MGIVRESISFKRGRDPKRAMDIGLSPRQRFEMIEPGDIYVTLEDMPGISIRKNSYVLVLHVNNDGYDHREVKYAISDNLKHLKSKYRDMGFSHWGWPYSFFIECLDKVDHIELDSSVSESLNFKRGKDPKKTMEIGMNNPRYAFDNLAVGDVFRLKKGIRNFEYPRGLYILVTGMVEDKEYGPNEKKIMYKVSDDSETFMAPAGYTGAGYSGVWGIPYDFFAEYFEKVGRKEIPQE